MPLFRIVDDGEELFICCDSMLLALSAWMRRVARAIGSTFEEMHEEQPDSIALIAEDSQCLNPCGYTVEEHADGTADCEDAEASHDPENN
jgi:hypothetical protein